MFIQGIRSRAPFLSCQKQTGQSFHPLLRWSRAAAEQLLGNTQQTAERSSKSILDRQDRRVQISPGPEPPMPPPQLPQAQHLSMRSGPPDVTGRVGVTIVNETAPSQAEGFRALGNTDADCPQSSRPF